MTDTETFKNLALSLPGTEQKPHFERIAFKVVNKRIFATLHEANATANMKLPPADQQVFCDYNQDAIYAVPNKWGLQGWTTFELSKVSPELIAEALYVAYHDVIQGKSKK